MPILYTSVLFQSVTILIKGTTQKITFTLSVTRLWIPMSTWIILTDDWIGTMLCCLKGHQFQGCHIFQFHSCSFFQGSILLICSHNIWVMVNSKLLTIRSNPSVVALAALFQVNDTLVRTRIMSPCWHFMALTLLLNSNLSVQGSRRNLLHGELTQLHLGAPD